MKIRIQDDIKKLNDLGLLEKLLKDKTTKRNIIWATNDYTAYGTAFGRENEIKLPQIIGSELIKSRAQKDSDLQSNRTKKHAEVFTPVWICNKMNNHVDDDWFGYSGAFNDGETPTKKVLFPEGRPWQDYVNSKRLEITCGEAPFLVSRYDAATGEIIEIENRIGILDRKLRIINENAESEEEWLEWVIKAYQNSYGYEFQGDSLLIARINMLMSFIEYMLYRWKREPSKKELSKVLNIILWNIWQMDGLTGTVPYGKPEERFEQISMFPIPQQISINDDIFKHPPCRIFDWRANKSVLFKND